MNNPQNQSEHGGWLVGLVLGAVPSVLLPIGVIAWLLGFRVAAMLAFGLLVAMLGMVVVWSLWRGVRAPREAAQQWGEYSRREKAIAGTAVGVVGFLLLALIVTLIVLYVV